MSNAQAHNLTGDITLNGGEETPISVVDAENVHFRRQSVTGSVKLINPEYVFSCQRPTEQTVQPGETETTVSGSIEDIYVAHDGVDGTVVIDGAQDVYIEPNAITGDIEIVGEEQLFYNQLTDSPYGYDAYDAHGLGWKRSVSVSDPKHGVSVTGGRCTAEITDVTADIELIVSGWNNTIDITGRTAMVTVYLLGSQNTVRTSPYIDLETDIQAGVENTIEQEPVPASDIIETTRKEAYAGHLLGRDTVTFQEPATDRDYCPNCGANASAIITRRQEDALFLTNTPVYRFDAGGNSYECENCSVNATPDIQLSEEERKRVLG